MIFLLPVFRSPLDLYLDHRWGRLQAQARFLSPAAAAIRWHSLGTSSRATSAALPKEIGTWEHLRKNLKNSTVAAGSARRGTITGPRDAESFTARQVSAASAAFSIYFRGKDVFCLFPQSNQALQAAPAPSSPAALGRTDHSRECHGPGLSLPSLPSCP